VVHAISTTLSIDQQSSPAQVLNRLLFATPKQNDFNLCALHFLGARCDVLFFSALEMPCINEKQ